MAKAQPPPANKLSISLLCGDKELKKHSPLFENNNHIIKAWLEKTNCHQIKDLQLNQH